MADIKDLVLLRNDPAVADSFLKDALRGDVDAQYGLGLIYAEGRGVQQDEARAFFWLSRAVEQGDRDALTLRNNLAVNMTPTQFEEADAMTNEYLRSLEGQTSIAVTPTGRVRQVRH